MAASIHPEASTRVRRRFTVITAELSPNRYSERTFLALETYCANTTPRRVAAVLLLTPLPGLIASALPAIVPLQDPTFGFRSSHNILVHAFLFISIVSFGSITLIMGATKVPTGVYSLREVGLVSLCGSTLTISFVSIPCVYWRFPIPFLVLFAAPFWMFSLVVAHVLVLRRKMWEHDIIRMSIKRYFVPLNVQTLQLITYAGFTVLFERVGPTLQLVLIALFPVVKYAFKRILRYVTKALHDMSAEVAISTVEICGSLYQALILQSSPSVWAIVVLLLLDFVQGIISIKYFMDKKSAVPRHRLVQTAHSLIRLQRNSGQPHQQAWTDLVLVLPAKSTEKSSRLMKTTIIRQALEFCYQAEIMLLIEYYEVAIPVVNVLFVLLTYRSTSTRYNTKLASFYNNHEAVVASIQPVALYSFLQGLSLVVMHFVMRYRYGVSALYHLAFALERHGRSIQGKMIAFLPLIFYFTLVHYGADFSLKFDYTALMKRAELDGRTDELSDLPAGKQMPVVLIKHLKRCVS
ncbi:hypothetical protein Poli38472_000804 [Pythium oligandrum]|uniref:Uncharacterized protein n=1 Tax=Pythium oligandrum TaxID=41045 RepID=A0A8K1CEH8_PYTOL|nr:hypothetical protein Poli38472_000804 [Pythium oligandrum]|eukprot:TMW60762.1 hypothetical protein Poli38472_000804 [Pythium oligandrum]